ncbi:uncharacterized protein [Malus domestica]|uniref:uncharacterized protein n=1 Tax=Malus domestica TaxID=3750 RepID=UPI003974F897
MAPSSSSTLANRDASASAAEDEAVMSVTRAFAQVALLQFQPGKFDQRLTALSECLKRKPNDPKTFHNIGLANREGCSDPKRLLDVLYDVKVYNQNYAFPALSNLKHLELLVDANYCLSLGRLASFMKAAPDLRSLVLGLGFGTSNEDMAILEKVSKQPHHCLKVVEIAGYRGHKCCVKHGRYLGEECCCTREDCYKSCPVLVSAYGNRDQLPTGE